jgi:tRNA(Phe) wybutosine-synthesizing methylase Tyw3
VEEDLRPALAVTVGALLGGELHVVLRAPQSVVELLDRGPSLHGLKGSPLLSINNASVATIRKTARTDMDMAMNARTFCDVTPVRMWLRMSNNAATQRKHNARIMRLCTR